MNHLLNRFNELGTAYNLSFTSLEVFNNIMMGLDGLRRKFMVLTQKDNRSFDHYVIDLDEVKNFSMEKHYGKIRAGDLRKNKLEAFLEKLAFRFSFHSGKEPKEVAFHKPVAHKKYHLQDIERKAMHWKQVLSKMLKAPLQKMA
jgi:hypothetical protein